MGFDHLHNLNYATSINYMRDTSFILNEVIRSIPQLWRFALLHSCIPFGNSMESEAHGENYKHT